METTTTETRGDGKEEWCPCRWIGIEAKGRPAYLSVGTEMRKETIRSEGGPVVCW